MTRTLDTDNAAALADNLSREASKRAARGTTPSTGLGSCTVRRTRQVLDARASVVPQSLHGPSARAIALTLRLSWSGRGVVTHHVRLSLGGAMSGVIRAFHQWHPHAISVISRGTTIECPIGTAAQRLKRSLR